MWYFQRLAPFFYAPPVSTSQGEEDEWLVYQVTRNLKEQSKDALPSPSSVVEYESAIVPSVPTPIVLARPPLFKFIRGGEREVIHVLHQFPRHLILLCLIPQICNCFSRLHLRTQNSEGGFESSRMV